MIALGGAAGACARYGATVLWPVVPGTFPWTTFWINVIGSATLGVLMVVLTERAAAPHPLVRPFLGTGVLGGFTTFSTFAVDAQQLLSHRHLATALLYVVTTLVAGGIAVWIAAGIARRSVRGGSRRSHT
ncbi:fluoride efflux transporter CrcB [Kribbella italica]|uniref:Fluoride-specific ion channel FluC n=1 Tax=Kribbella italica TaxID=1540520 RepID=A0A7W9MY83_9ACTN|nr:fluoride efflux transporter CrcB [Kribbella italica]MBB5840569.1 CrcB protein [Kribbella italica]